jgi:hypothetical protein
MKNTSLCIIFLMATYTFAQSQTIYFLVANFDPNSRTDSYVLPLTEPNDIAHARDLIANGPGVGRPLVVASIACGANGINRNFLSSSKNQWLWHITQFIGFADITIEILDGNPTFVNNDCSSWMTGSGGKIGFWSYTVIAEIGENPKPWQGDFDYDSYVNMNDLAIFNQEYYMGDCEYNNWCMGTDLNRDGVVDADDVILFANLWLSPFAEHPVWFSEWSCPWQCHGDVDCAEQGSSKTGYFRVLTNDLSMMGVCIGGSCGGRWYDPRCDFDRDCDVDDNDQAILNRWYRQPNVPADCPAEP